MHCEQKLADGLFWIGGDDKRLGLFEGCHPVPHGMSYNNYLLLDEKVVLFDTIDRAVRKLVRSGIPVVAAAGNQGENACRHSPARLPSVITVGASTQQDRAWSGFNQGRCVDIFAPGKGISSVLADGGVFRYTHVGATSWATPFVTGAVALYLQDNPLATPSQVRRALRQSATAGVLDGLDRGSPNRLLFVGAL